MTPTRIITGIFGGAYLGAISIKVPGILGYAYRPTLKAELVAALAGMLLAGFVCVREHLNERKCAQPLKLGR